MKTILAFDLATRQVGVSVYVESKPGVFTLDYCKQIELNGKELTNRMWDLHLEIEQLLVTYNVTEACTELPTAFGHGIKVAYAVGVLYAQCGSDDIPIFLYSPGTVKKEFQGGGRASKEEMIEKYNELRPNHLATKKHADMVDAIAIGYTHIKKEYFNKTICLK